ncbi:hypothetical protein PC116_g27658 [Phytophthora cactorum]|nr:hypothetical protein PC116_g27658 [Phytophthora cactorum]
MFFSTGNRPLSSFMSEDLPDPGWPRTSVIVPGLKTPLTFLRTCFLTTCLLERISRKPVLMTLTRVGSSTVASVSSLTMMSAEIETSRNRTSICGRFLPSAFSIREATWSCSACGPCAMSVLPLSYSMVARMGAFDAFVAILTASLFQQLALRNSEELVSLVGLKLQSDRSIGESCRLAARCAATCTLIADQLLR